MNELNQNFRIEIKEDYLDLVPRPNKEEYQSLRDSLDMEGQKDPIVINSKGIILDGHTRYEIIRNLGREVDYRIKDFDNLNDERYYVIETNLNRRQFNAFQKVELAMILSDDIKRQLRERNKSGGGRHESDGKHLSWRKELSKRIAVGENQCQQAQAIIKANDPYLLANLRENKISIEQAYLTIRPGQLSSAEKKRRSNIARKYECPMCKSHIQKKEMKLVG